jgi:hypothetical protein
MIDGVLTHIIKQVKDTQVGAETVAGVEFENEAQSVGTRTRGASIYVEIQKLMGSRWFD